MKNKTLNIKNTFKTYLKILKTDYLGFKIDFHFIKIIKQFLKTIF